VALKKYFYALRPLLSVRWLERYGTPAPIEFDKLLHLVDEDRPLLDDIDALLAKKRAAPEMGLAPQVPGIHRFIERELERLELTKPAGASPAAGMDRLNGVFRGIVHGG